MAQYSPPGNDSADFEAVDSGYSAPGNDSADFAEFVPLSAPSNVHFNDTTTEDELTLDWDEVSNASGYFVYRAQSSGSSTSDYTQVADVTSPPYTETGLEDGEKYYYRVSAHD